MWKWVCKAFKAWKSSSSKGWDLSTQSTITFTLNTINIKIHKYKYTYRDWRRRWCRWGWRRVQKLEQVATQIAKVSSFAIRLDIRCTSSIWGKIKSKKKNPNFKIFFFFFFFFLQFCLWSSGSETRLESQERERGEGRGSNLVLRARL